MAIRKEVLQRRGALASAATRAPAGALDTADDGRRSIACCTWVTLTERAWNGSRSEGQGRDGRRREPRARLRRRARRWRAKGRIVSISSSNAGVDRRGREADLVGRRARCSATPVDVRNGDQIAAWAAEDDRAVRRRRSAVHQRRRAAGRRRVSFDDAAWQNAVDLLLFSTLRMVRAAVPSMKQRGGGAILDVDLVVGQGADPEPRAVDRAARVGVGAGEDAGARARRRQDPRQPDHSRAASTPTASASSTRSPARSRASPPTRRRRSRWRRSRWAATASRRSSAASPRSCSRTRPPT